MTKRSGAFDIQLDTKDLIFTGEPNKKHSSMSIEKALETITKQMVVSGFRRRTVSDYNLHMTHFCEITGVKYVNEINVETVYQWLGSMNVSDATKLIRLKCMKAIFGKFLITDGCR